MLAGDGPDGGQGANRLTSDLQMMQRIVPDRTTHLGDGGDCRICLQLFDQSEIRAKEYAGLNATQSSSDCTV